MLSVIIPHYHEHPQLVFTLQSIINEFELIGYSYEVILVDNAPYPQHEHVELDSSKYINKKIADGCLKKVTTTSYIDTLSHWQAKNVGIDLAKGELLLFLDAHVVISPFAIRSMLDSFASLPSNSSLHLPISYMLDNRQLIYKLIYNLDDGVVDYKFACNTTELVTEVPCMSTCGMMISKDVMVEKFQCWPTSLGSYSGGEHYINFVGAVLGIKKYICNSGTIYHYAAPRAYELNLKDVYRNRAISTYLFGGIDLFDKYLNYLGRSKRGEVSIRLVNQMRLDIPNIPDIQGRRQYIKDNSICSIDTFVKQWSRV